MTANNLFDIKIMLLTIKTQTKCINKAQTISCFVETILFHLYEDCTPAPPPPPPDICHSPIAVHTNSLTGALVMNRIGPSNQFIVISFQFCEKIITV